MTSLSSYSNSNLADLQVIGCFVYEIWIEWKEEEVDNDLKDRVNMVWQIIKDKG